MKTMPMMQSQRMKSRKKEAEPDEPRIREKGMKTKAVLPKKERVRPRRSWLKDRPNLSWILVMATVI